jgi:hypothetical protein
MKGLDIVWLNVFNRRVTRSEVIEKDAYMQAAVVDRFAVKSAAEEVLSVFVKFGIFTRRRGPLPLNKAQELVNP